MLREALIGSPVHNFRLSKRVKFTNKWCTTHKEQRIVRDEVGGGGDTVWLRRLNEEKMMDKYSYYLFVAVIIKTLRRHIKKVRI